jgi:hypothetical protein
VIPAGLADLIRYVDAALALGLVAACSVAIALGDHWDQRVRFGVFAALGGLLTAGHLATLGRDGSWRLLMLVPVVVLALISTVAYVLRERRERRVR